MRDGKKTRHLRNGVSGDEDLVEFGSVIGARMYKEVGLYRVLPSSLPCQVVTLPVKSGQGTSFACVVQVEC